VTNKTMEQRSAEALAATFLQMSRSAEMARAIQRMRQRTLENRVRRTTDARELVKLQARLDAQQSQAAVIEAATDRFRYQAPNLAQFAKSGMTMEDFNRLGVSHVIEPSRLAAEIERVKLGVSVPVPSLTPRQMARLRTQEGEQGQPAEKAKPPAAKPRRAKAPRAKAAAPGEPPPAAGAPPGETPHARHGGAAHRGSAAHQGDAGRKRTPRKRSHHRKDDD
jgi:hypothetical protein